MRLMSGKIMVHNRSHMDIIGHKVVKILSVYKNNKCQSTSEYNK